MDKKVIKLANGLEAFIISDPLLNKSSCAIDVAVGSLEDPKAHQGMAHLLEHLSFMGTKKYPRKGEFHEYLSSSQGVFNASTGLEHTNYRFEIDHGAFEAALDRFSQFFIAPLLKSKFIEAEKQVISSEFSRNKLDDSLREQRIFQLTCSKDHPITQCHHGNMRTLKGIGRDELYDFFNSQYSASKMKLVVLSKLDIQSLEKIIIKYFSDIKDLRDKNALSSDVNLYPAPVFDTSSLPQHVSFVSKTGTDTLKLCFETKSLYSQYRSKPAWILNFLLNTTRRGSLAGQLKKDGLVSELWSSSNTFSFTAFIFVELKLTDKGAKNIKKIIEEFFAYMNMIKRIGYPRYVYEEQKIISDIGYKFKEHSEGLNVVKNLAKNMHYYPALDAEKCNDLIFEYDQASFNELLSSIDPEKMKVISKVAKGTLAEKDSCYGISYSVSKFSKATIKRFKEASNASFKYPERNIFVPQDFKPAMDDPTPYPHKIMDNEKGVIWYVQSKDELPLSYLNLLIITNAVNSDARSKLLSIIYTKLVLERLSDVADMAGDAGLSFGIERDDRGISLFFVGYSDKTIELAKSIVNELKAPFDDKQAFDDIRAGLADDYDGLLNGSSYDIAQYHRHNAVHTRHIHFSEYVGKLKNVTLSDVNNFIPKIYELISLEGYCYGSLSPKDIVGLSEYTHSFLNAGAMLRTDIPKDDIIACQLGEIHELHIRSKANDHCWASFFEFGERSTKLSAVIQLGYVLLEPFFFNQIRNKEQIAYVVETRLDFFEKVLGLSFTILSDRYKSEDIAAKAQLVMDKFLKQLNKITEEQFSNSKQALINKIRKTNHTLEEWMSEIVLTATLKGDAQYGEKLAAEISVLTIEEIKTVFSKAFNTKTRMSVSIYVDHV